MTRWPRVLTFGLPAALLSLLLTACAGGFSSDRTETSIVTEPAGADCTLEGTKFSATVRTPARIVLPKEAAPVALSCGRSGHRAFVTVLKPRFNEKIFGNLMLGSLAGLIVDFANGHDTKYPEQVSIHLEPAAFATVEARDAWFGRYRSHVALKWNREEARLIDACKADGEGSGCFEKQKSVAENRARELDALERRRRQAHIDAHSTAEWPVGAPSVPQ